MAHQVAIGDPGRRLPLSSREKEHLVFLARGPSYKQIAAVTGLSHSSVRSHVHHIYVKTGATDRSQAVMLAYRLGWLSSPESVRGLKDRLQEIAPPDGSLAGLVFSGWIAGLLAGLTQTE